MHRYSLKIILRKSYVRKDGTCQALLQAFINTKRVKIPLNVFVNPDHFDEKKVHINYPNKSTRDQKKEIDDLNLYLNNCRAKASNIFTHHRLTDRSLSPAAFKKLYQETISHLDFLAFMEGEIKLLAPLRAKNTVKSYNNTLNKLKEHKGEVMFNDLTYTYITEFNHWLLVKKKLDKNTAWRHHRDIKTFINIAQKKGIAFDSPYKLFKATQSHSERTFLSKPEVDQLMNLYEEKSLPLHLQRSLRLFLFACWTGLRISDVFQVNSEMIMENQLVFIPVKSTNQRKILRVPLTETAKGFILNTIGDLFDPVSEKQVNIDLKEIAKLTKPKIKKRITFHVARHTFAMMFLEVPGNKVEVLKEILGHASIATTMIYVHIHGEYKKESMIRMDEYAKKNLQPPASEGA